jgi:hypothetical protein
MERRTMRIIARACQNNNPRFAALIATRFQIKRIPADIIMLCDEFVPLIKFIKKKDVHKIFNHYYGSSVAKEDMVVYSVTRNRPDLVELLYRKGFDYDEMFEYVTDINIYRTLHRLGYKFDGINVYHAITNNTKNILTFLIGLGLPVTTSDTTFAFSDNNECDMTDMIDFLIDLDAPFSIELIFEEDNITYFKYYMNKRYDIVIDNVDWTLEFCSFTANGIPCSIKTTDTRLISEVFKDWI